MMNKEWDIYYLKNQRCRKPLVITVTAESRVKALFKVEPDIGTDAVILNIFVKKENQG